MNKIKVSESSYIFAHNYLVIISFLGYSKKLLNVKLTLRDMQKLLPQLACIKFGDEINKFSSWSPNTTLYYCGKKQAILFKPNRRNAKQMTTLETLELIAYAKSALLQQESLAA